MTDLLTAVGDAPQVAQLADILIASIILVIISHQLPKMVAGIANGGHYGGHVGHVGALGALGVGMGIGRLAAGGAGPAFGAAAAAGNFAKDRIMERVSLMQAANASSGNGAGMVQPPSAVASNVASGAASVINSVQASRSNNSTSTGTSVTTPTPVETTMVSNSASNGAPRAEVSEAVSTAALAETEAREALDEVLERPMSPDEQWMLAQQEGGSAADDLAIDMERGQPDETKH